MPAGPRGKLAKLEEGEAGSGEAPRAESGCGLGGDPVASEAGG